MKIAFRNEDHILHFPLVDNLLFLEVDDIIEILDKLKKNHLVKGGYVKKVIIEPDNIAFVCDKKHFKHLK